MKQGSFKILAIILLLVFVSCEEADPTLNKSYKDVLLLQLNRFPEMTKKLAFEVSGCVIEKTGDLSVGEVRKKFNLKELKLIVMSCSRTLRMMVTTLLKDYSITSTQIQTITDCMEERSRAKTPWGLGQKFKTKEGQVAVFQDCVDELAKMMGSKDKRTKQKGLSYICVCGSDHEKAKTEGRFEVVGYSNVDYPSKQDIYKVAQDSCKTGTSTISCIGSKANRWATWTIIGLPKEYQPGHLPAGIVRPKNQ